MKAVLLTKTGTVGNLIFKEVNIGVPSQDEALVKIEYCGINHLDLLIRQGRRPGPKTFPHILGSEITGIVKQLGDTNRKYKIGDKVAVYPWTFCGKCKLCLEGYENICDHGGTIGRTGWGGYAENIIVPVKNLVKIPNRLSLEKACAATLTGATAYHLISRAKLKTRSRVLITGGSGGVGTMAIQLLKFRQCRIIACTSHNRKKSVLKKLGVHHIVSTTNLTEEVKKICPRGVDCVIDIVGGQIWSEAVKVLAKNGTLVFCATTLDDMGMVQIGSAFSRQINILGSYGGTIKDLRTIFRLLEKRKLQPVIDSIYPLRKAPEALKKLDNQDVFGKILLQSLT